MENISPKGIVWKIAGIMALSMVSFFVIRTLPLKPAGTEIANEIQPNPTSIFPTDEDQATPSPKKTSTPTPTPKPLTFKEMNQLYGPCVNLPALMYHHIQKTYSEPQYLTVTTDTFRQQLTYLKNRGYQTISAKELGDFFGQGSALPAKGVLLTFDDGYFDFFSEAYPILKEMGLKATVFIITGFIDQPGYLTWDAIGEMNRSGLVLFANHTNTHQMMNSDWQTVENEIMIADVALKQRQSNVPKSFAYPFGVTGNSAIKILADQDYSLAFTTQSSTIHCEGKRFALPRLRIGNASLKAYGL